MMMFLQNWIGYARALFVGALVFISSPTIASDRETLRGIALLIGNSEYEHLAQLANPENDVDAIEEVLDALGFETYLSTDRDGRRLKRDLENFLDDAQDADVALLYYAGHGIEAGGENYLVPVDADISDTDEGLTGLFPMNAYVDKLHQTVSVAVVLLDACRDNPFPSNYQLTLPGSPEPVNISAAGLEIPTLTSRGAMLFDDEESRVVENVVTMVGFAAQPGEAALDGEPGTNSPYAKAILRHLGASNSERFSTVMSMISEEVYLKTKGRQRPWVNQSIRRELYFGGAADEGDADLATVTKERRGLLVHIVGLSDAQRSTVESLAAAEKIPADIAYAIMRASGIPADAKAEDIEVQLRAKLDTIVSLQENAGALNNPDPEVQRLTNLADQAELEGALNAANRFRDLTKARVEEMQDTREQQVEALTQRILEDAAVFEKSAQTKILLNDYEAATEDYETAIHMVKNWDADQAFEYRFQQLKILLEAYKSLNLVYGSAKLKELVQNEVDRPTLPWNDTQRAQLLEFLGIAEQTDYVASHDLEDFEAARTYFQTAIDLFDKEENLKRGKAYLNLAALNYLRGWINWSEEHEEYYNRAVDLAQVVKTEIDPENTHIDMLRGAVTPLLEIDVKRADAGLPEPNLGAALDQALGDRATEILANTYNVEGLSFMYLSHWRDKTLYEQKATDSLTASANLFASKPNAAGFAAVLTDMGDLHSRRAGRGVEGAAQLALDHYNKALESLDPQAQPVKFSIAFGAMLDMVSLNPSLLSEQSILNAMRHGQLWEGVSSAEGLEDSISSVEYLMGRVMFLRAAQSQTREDMLASREWFAQFKANAEPGTWLSAKADEALATANTGLAFVTQDVNVMRQALKHYNSAAETYGKLNSEADEARGLSNKAGALTEIALLTNALDDLNAAYEAFEVWLDLPETYATNYTAADNRYKLGQLSHQIGLVTSDADAFDRAAQWYSTSADMLAADSHADDAVLARFHAALALDAKSRLLVQQDTYDVALQAYRNVLNEPGQLAAENEYNIQMNMGNVLLNLLAFDLEEEIFVAAADHFDLALQLVKANGALRPSEHWPNRSALEREAWTTLSSVLFKHGELFEDIASLERSAQSFFDLAESMPNAKVEQASNLNGSAYALILGHRLSQNPAALDVALDRVRASLDVLEVESAGATMLPFAQGTLCDALIEKSVLENDRTFAEQALPTCEKSHAGLLSLGQVEAVQIAETSLARVRELLEN